MVKTEVGGITVGVREVLLEEIQICWEIWDVD